MVVGEVVVAVAAGVVQVFSHKMIKDSEVNISYAQGAEEEEGSGEGEVHPGVAVDSGVGELEEADSGGEGVEGVSEEEGGAELDLKNFILSCFGIHIASADFHFFQHT